MMKVNNRKAIRRLAFRELKASRRMNVVVILSIVLTCILFTALTSIGGSLINGAQQETMRLVGGDRMAGLKYVLPEDYEKVRADQAVRDVVYRTVVGFAVNDAIKNSSVEVNCAGDESAAEAVFCNPTTGRLPESYDEIAVSTLVLDELGLPYELGITVPVTLDVDGEISEHEFILCGYWQGEKVAAAQECWVSQAFADEYAPTPTESFYAQELPKYAGYYMVDFNYINTWNIEGKTARLLERLYGDSEIIPDAGINWAYTTSTVDGGTLAGGIAILLVIFLAGYLIIYNIFYINISANIRSYGLLKTIGTTARQIRRMVRVQAAVYCAAGIPLGLLAGILLGRVLLKSIMRMLDIYSSASYTVSAGLLALLCAVSAAFTFATVMISCRRPCKIAGSVSPVEALRYNDTTIRTKKKTKRTGKITPFSVARNNLSRSRRKTIVAVCSLTLSMLLVNTLFTVLNGVDFDQFISAQMIGDFIITHESGSYDSDALFSITPEQAQYLESIDGAAQTSAIYFQWGTLDFTGQQLEELKAFCEKYADTDQYGSLSQAASDGEIPTDLYGIPGGIWNLLEPTQGGLDAEKWSSGSYALVTTAYLGAVVENGEDSFYSVGDTLTLTAEDGKTKTYEVMAVCEMPYALSSQRYSILGGQVMLPDSEYFSLTDNRNAMTVMINAEDGRYEDVEEQIRRITDGGDSQVTLKSKQTYADEYDDLLKMVKLVGGALSGILALIGILNFVNAVATGILARRRELAMMNAVGMTGRQLTAMLMWEGVSYAALTAVCSIIAGTFFSYVVVKSVAGELFFYTFHFTLLPILVCVLILLLLSAVIPSVSYRTICRDSVVERL